MLFAFRVAKHVKSNAIVYAKDGATVGVGAGQMSRVDSSRIAAWKAGEAAAAAKLAAPLTHGSVVASDAFFPFADGMIAAARLGPPPSSSPAAQCATPKSSPPPTSAALAMVFTGIRHFRQLRRTMYRDVRQMTLTYRVKASPSICLDGTTRLLKQSIHTADDMEGSDGY